MADLGTLALGTYTNVSNTAITGTNPVLEVIGSTDDADFVFDNSNSDHTSDCWFDIATTLPSDLGNVDTLSINLRYGLSTTKGTNDWLSLRAQVFKSDGTTPLTNQLIVVDGGTGISNTTPANSGAVAFTGVDTAATKAEWQAAQVHILFEINRDAGGDSVVERVYAAELTGTYTEAGATIIEADGASDGVASVDGDGVAIWNTEGSSTGAATLDGDGVALWLTDGSSTAAASVDGQGAAVIPADGSSTATATAEADSATIIAADGSSTAGATVSGDGGDAVRPVTYHLTQLAPHGTPSQHYASFAGRGGPTIIEADGQASGSATTTGIGVYFVQADGASAGVSTNNAVSSAIWQSDGASVGLAEALGVGALHFATVASSTGQATVTGLMEDAALPPQTSKIDQTYRRRGRR